MSITGQKYDTKVGVRKVILTTGPQLHPFSQAQNASQNYYCRGFDMNGFQYEIDLQAMPPGVTIDQIQVNQVWWVEKRTSLYRLYLYAGTYNPSTRQITSTDQLPQIISPKYYANYYSTQTQTAPVAQKPYLATFDVTSDANGFTIDSTKTQITSTYGGTYQFIFSAQIINNNTSGTATNNATFWIRQNGIDVPWSAGEVTSFSKGGGVTPGLLESWNFIVEMQPGDYIQLVWSTDNSSNYLQIVAQPSPPYGPAVPSFTITATQI